MNITEITAPKSKTGEPIRLAAYCRVSSDSEDQLHSFAAQIRYYSEYTKKHPEYRLVDIYADEGLSGTDMKKRDEQNRLIRDCKTRKGKSTGSSSNRFPGSLETLRNCSSPCGYSKRSASASTLKSRGLTPTN